MFRAKRRRRSFFLSRRMMGRNHGLPEEIIMLAAILIPLFAHHPSPHGGRLVAVEPVSFQIVQHTSVPAPPAVMPPSMPAEGDSAQERSTPKPPHFRMAAGFGRRVPLGFAVRQIVPRGVAVTYGPGTDQGQPVDWQGGRMWNRVLATTVAQCGYRIDVGRNRVTILQQKGSRSHDEA